jgi:photosystem II stability/assembly factor-like uncharacterized protein
LVDRRFVHALAGALAACACVGGFAAATAPAATSTTDVNANVLDAIQLDDSGCRASAAHDFGNVAPNVPVLTGTCRIAFQSSNDTAMLRIGKRTLDATSPAMVRETWSFTQQRAATGVALNDLEAHGKDLVWAVGDGGTILRTTDGGTTWNTIASGVTEDLRRIADADGTNRWTVGTAGRVLHSTDAGVTWSPQSAGTAANLGDVDVVGNQVWVAGDGGVVRRSDDAGATWTSASIPTAGNVRGIAVLAPGTAVAVTAGPMETWRTTDRGVTWTMVASAAGCGWGGIDAASPTVLYVTGCSNWVGRSADGGVTWNQRADAWSEAYDVEALSPDIAYFGDAGGGIDRTYDGLATLPFHPNSIAGSAGNILGIAAAGLDRIWIANNAGVIMRSNPSANVSDYGAGANWSSGSATSTFGTCVQAAGATTTAVWAVDTTGTPGTCQANDTDTWHAVPGSMTKIAQTAIAAPGQVDLVWGLRPSSSQTAGLYAAAVYIEALAPAV